MNDNTLFDAYIRQGWVLVPIETGQKGPRGLSWNLRANCELPPGWTGSAGLAHAYSGTCAGDVDAMGEAETLLRLGFKIELRDYFTRPETVEIRSGVSDHGKLLWAMPPGLVMPTKALTYQGRHIFQFRCGTLGGRTVQDVLPPSLHPSGERYHWAGGGDWRELEIIPGELLDLWEDWINPAVVRHIGDVPEASLGEIRSALSVLDPDCDRDTWLQVGMALHSTGEDLYEEWDQWSAGGAKYRGQGDTGTVWRSLTLQPPGQGITLKTLFWRARQRGWRGNIDVQALFRSQVPSPIPAPSVPGHAAEEGATQVGGQQETGTPEQGLPTYDDLQAEAQRLAGGDREGAYQLLGRLLHLPRTDARLITGTIAERANLPLRELNSDLTTLRREAERRVREQARGQTLEFRWINQVGNPSAHLENFSRLIEHYGIQLRYNEMTHEADLSAPNVEWSQDNWKNEQISHVRDLMAEHLMERERAKELMDVYASHHAYHPFRQTLDQTEWDGTSRWPWVKETIKSPDPELRDLYLRRWLTSIIAAVYRREDQLAPRGVLVFCGPQKRGKTKWLEYITPPGMFGEGKMLLPGNKDMEKQVLGYLVTELGEIEETFQSGRLGMIKAFVSRGKDELRTPYAMSESTWPRRTVLAGSVNHRDFLQDETGNTRFWVIDTPEFDLDAMEQLHRSGELWQFWAEVKSWFMNDEPYHLSREETEQLEESNERFRAITPLEALLQERFLWDSPKEQWGWKTAHDIYEAVDPQGRHKASYKMLSAMISRLTGELHSRKMRVNGKQGWYWRVPPRMFEAFQGGKGESEE